MLNAVKEAGDNIGLLSLLGSQGYCATGLRVWAVINLRRTPLYIPAADDDE